MSDAYRLEDCQSKDAFARREALNPLKSFIVQAPAGSGKTEILIQRILKLLARVSTPQEILAITFTKKAANEMRLRLIAALQSALSAVPESAHKKVTWHLAKAVLAQDEKYQWNLIDNPNQLRIQTIDSFCTYLTKQLPLLSQFGAPPELEENPANLYRSACEEILHYLEDEGIWQKDFAKLLLHLDNDLEKFQNLLQNLLAKREQWLPYVFFEDPEAARLQLEKQLQLVISDHLLMLKACFPAEIIEDLLSSARYAASELKLNYLSDFTQLPGTDAQAKQQWLFIAKLLLTKKLTWRKRFDAEMGFKALASFTTKEEKLAHKRQCEKLNHVIDICCLQKDLLQALVDLHYLPNAQYTDPQWDILHSLIQILKLANAQLRLVFKRHGQIDFIENAQAALFALGSAEQPTDLTLFLDYQIKHILVDEFQDTSFTQFNLLERLTAGFEDQDGRTLFIVGDPMQSIYRFREAEVGLFLRAQENGIGQVRLTPLSLSLNFRSHADIVEWNNKHYQHIFPKHANIATGAIAYNQSYPTVSDNSQNNITLHGFVNTVNGEAEAICKQIKALIQHNPHDKIAVLVRSRSHLTSLVPLLKQQHIEYHAIDIDPLLKRQCIQDLFSLTRALLHPADRIAWLSLLRAPWCGLTLKDLFMIAHKNPNTPIMEQLANPLVTELLSQDGYSRVQRILPILKSKLIQRERLNLRTWIESTWLLLGGPASLNTASEIQDAEAYFNLLDGLLPLNVSALKEKLNQLYAPPSAKAAQLEIMTIHSAKGLEFDHVILPYLERKLPYDERSLLQWMELPLNANLNALLLAPIHASGENIDPIYQYIERQRRLKDAFEVDRLLYVASTRAKKSMHFYFNLDNLEDPRIEKNSFLEKLWPFFQNQAELICTSQAAETEKVPEKRYLYRFKQNWQNPIQDLPQALTLHNDTPGFTFEQHFKREVGTATHYLLQQIANKGMDWWLKQTKTEKHLYLENYLSLMHFSMRETQLAVDTIEKFIANTLNDDRGQWILHPHTDAKAEFAITTISNQKLEHLIVDRTFIDEHGEHWIIDYKTTIYTQADITDFLKAESDKYRRKMQCYAKALRSLKDAPLRLGLYFPALPAWQEIVA